MNPSLRRVLSLLGAIGGALLLAAGAAQGATTNTVPVLTATGVVDSVMAGYIADGIARAESTGAPAIVITLNTPGGSLDATQTITSAELKATIPTIIWVAPPGGRAASAGTFITQAAALAYMAPGTNIGAAAPVDSSGNDIPGTEGVKVKNDAIANMTAIAEARGRNVDWAVSTVRDAKSYPASAAVAAGAVDGLAMNLEEIRTKATGKTVDLAGQPTTVDLSDATFEDQPMSPFQQLFQLLSDPNIAFVLFLVGAFGLILELAHPNFASGAIGAVAMILAFIGFGSLPLNLAGLLLIGLAIALFAVDVTVTNHGLPTVAGIASLVLGASALYSAPGTPTAPDVSVAWPLIAVVAVVSAGLMLVVLRVSVRARRALHAPGTVSAGLPIGAEGVVRRPIDPEGSVYAGGEEWSARSVDDRPIARDTPVDVVAADGLTLLVSPVPDRPDVPPPPAGTPGAPRPSPDAPTVSFDPGGAGRVSSG